MDRYQNYIDQMYSYKGIVRTFPVPLVRIANALGYKVFDFNLTEENHHVSGAVKYDQKQILLNPKEADTRKRFTLAHEIGHIVLGHNEDGRSIDTRDDILSPACGTNEWNANEFAAELLMPADEFFRVWQSSNSIAKMAEHFDVSLSAVIVRMQVLGINYVG